MAFNSDNPFSRSSFNSSNSSSPFVWATESESHAQASTSSFENTFAFVVQVAESRLRSDIALLSGLPPPLDRFDLVFGNVFAVDVHVAELALRVGVSLLSSTVEPLSKVTSPSNILDVGVALLVDPKRAEEN